MVSIQEATVPFTWDYDVDGFFITSFEVVATVVVADNRPVITGLQMIGNKPYPSKETSLSDLPDTLKGLAFDDLSKNRRFLADATESLEGVGHVFDDENSFGALFVQPFSEMFGVREATQ
ncbi:hypothetical protein [Kiloniella antarctica]|uniref:Uncharacterized protein n=1 Tax=Kiloniella antarctica TaxID=1550907 RepID=A0ABW5BLX9_9PROT